MNKQCNETIKKLHTWQKNGTITKNATCTEKGIKEFSCTAEGCTQKKTATIKKKAHNYQIVTDLSTDSRFQVNHTYHYKKCTMCNSFIAEKHSVNKNDETGTCKKCGQIHKYEVYKTDHLNHYTKCSNPDCQAEHLIQKHVYNKKGVCKTCNENHKVKTIAKDSVIHITKCSETNCTFQQVEENHTYTKYTSTEKCPKCGRTWGYNVREIQRELFELGYFEGIYETKEKAVDGNLGAKTYNALNEFLELEGVNKKVGNPKEITADIFQKLQTATKTKAELLQYKTENNITLLKNNTKLMNELFNSDKNKELVRIIGNDKNMFNIVVLMCNYSKNTYSYSSSSGKDKIRSIINNPPVTEEETNKVINSLKNDTLGFDCSAFASTVMNLAYGINCYTYSTANYNPYDGKKLKKNHPFKIKQEITKGDGKKINYSNMKKGDLLLCIRSKGSGHVLVCLGNGYAIHAYTSGKPITIVNFNEKQESNYLKTEGDGNDNKKVIVLSH